MANVPVFISFDYDHDDDLRNALVAQARNPDSPFTVADWSIKEASADWKEKARWRIRRAEQVIVICGHYTESATGVNVEIAIARDERRPYFLLAGRADGNNKKPTGAASTDKVYQWTWPNLKALIAGGR
ncbi:MAG TPA: TIR domain-containing protein [Candidatus Nitrosopolaris sp.]|nr:TIR domain-containing protein [Candidatus Nitrosopolaris sp.]